LLLVDDGSSDASTEMARDYAARHPRRVRYLEHPGHQNRGMSPSRNLGIRQARGNYIAFIDADDVWLPEKLSQQMAIMESHPTAGMVCGAAEYWYSWTGQPGDLSRDKVHYLAFSSDTLANPHDMLKASYPLGEGEETPTPSGMMLRRTAVQTVGGFEDQAPNLYDDQYFLAKVFLQIPVFVSRACWFRYRQHPDSCCGMPMPASTVNPIQESFMCWYGQYLAQQGVEDPFIWYRYRRATFRFRHPLIYRLRITSLSRRAVYLVRRLQKMIIPQRARG
jgi:glycosyltransferase involved in cell wall biosynthesis